MLGVEAEMQASLNVELAIHNLETLRVASISTREYQENIDQYQRPVTHCHCCTTSCIFITATPKFQPHKISHYTPT
jgi:succinate dehydrogenase/fumarate reductase-like Fe-S protein